MAVASNYIWVASVSLEHLWVGIGFTNRSSPTFALEISNNIITKLPFRLVMDVLPSHILFEPRNANGSRYDLVTVPDPYGGILVIWSGICTWRYYTPAYCHSIEGELKFLHGNHNTVDTLAVREYLDSIA